jgi:DNA-binding HxlR family transcriptional regulator
MPPPAIDPAAACNPDCPVLRASQVLDGKWTTLIVRDLLAGPRRFAELQRSVGRISPRLLTARLRLLQDEGVLERSVFPTNPPSTSYQLTAHGRQLLDVIQALAAFGQASQARDRSRARQAARAAAKAPPAPAGRVHRLR